MPRASKIRAWPRLVGRLLNAYPDLQVFHLLNLHSDALGLELGLDLLPDHTLQVYEFVKF